MRRRLMLKSRAGVTPVLPAEYQKVEWIESDGNQFIRTAFIPDNTCGIKIICETSSAGDSGSDVCACGTRTSSTRWFIGMSYRSWYYGWGTYYWQDEPTAFAGVFSTVSLNYKNDRKFVVDTSVSRDLPTSLATLSSPAAIFANNIDGNINYIFNGKISILEFTRGGSIEKQFIPCYRKADGVIGLYDTVSQTFLTNAGTGTFSKGADVN